MPGLDSLTHNTDSLVALYPALDTTGVMDWAAAEQARAAARVADSIASLLPPPPRWQEGLEPAPLPRGGASDPVMGAVLVAMLLIVTLSIRHCRRLIVNLAKDLLTIRSRSRDFIEHTANESRLMLLFGVQFTVYAGMLLEAAAAVHAGMPPFAGGFVRTLCFIALAAGLYIFQSAGYLAVGYAFTTSENAQMWLRGFNAAQSILGFALAVPAIVSVFYPDASMAMLYLAGTFYVLIRIIFIYKGFRIFYDNFLSLFYFILYLCALEIIPVALTLAGAFAIDR